MTNVRTRLATPEDLADVERIVRQAYAPWIPVIGQEPAPMHDDYAALIADGKVTLHERGVPLGLMVLLMREDVLQIDSVTVAPEAQGIGVGTALLHHAEKIGCDLGYDLLRLYTHVKMTSDINFYRGHGFRRAAEVREKGFDRLYMERYIGR